MPFLDTAVIKSWFEEQNTNGNIFSYLNVLSGDNFSKGTLLALSVSPYINAQIIIQLLTYALPPLERLAKEGMEGRKKIDKVTRYAALAISVFQAWAYYLTLKNQAHALVYTGSGFDSFSAAVGFEILENSFAEAEQFAKDFVDCEGKEYIKRQLTR